MRESIVTINSKHKTVKTFPADNASFDDHIKFAENMCEKSKLKKYTDEKRKLNQSHALRHIELALNSGLRENVQPEEMFAILNNSNLGSLLEKLQLAPVRDSSSNAFRLEQFAQPKKTTGLVGFFQSAYQFLANIATNAFNWITGKNSSSRSSSTDDNNTVSSNDTMSDLSSSSRSRSSTGSEMDEDMVYREAILDDEDVMSLNDLNSLDDDEEEILSNQRKNSLRQPDPIPSPTSEAPISHSQQTTEPSTAVESTPMKPSPSELTANTAAATPKPEAIAPAPAPAPAQVQVQVQAQALPEGNFYANISKEKVNDMLPAKPGIYYVLNDDKLSCIQKELVNGSLITNDDFPTVLLKKIHKKLINEKIGSPTEEASYQLKSEDISDIIRIAGAKYPKEIAHAKTDFASEIKRLKGLSDADITFTDTPRHGR